MSGDSNTDGESSRILNYLPSFLSQPMRIIDRVFRRVLDVGLSIGETLSINGSSARHDSDDPVPDPSLEADIEADVPNPTTMDMDSFNNYVKDSNRVVHNRSRNVARRGRPFINVDNIGRSNSRVPDVGQCISDTRSINSNSTPDNESVPNPASMDLDSDSDHVEFNSNHVIHNRMRNMAQRGRLFSNDTMRGHLSRNVARRGCSQRHSRHEHSMPHRHEHNNMPHRILLEGSELYFRINSNTYELEVATEVATEVTSEGDDGLLYNIRWQNYRDYSSTSEVNEQDFNESH